ncbi:unnamed protein product [Rhizopus stolonifer]
MSDSNQLEINKKKCKYILVTHGDSYLGHILALYLAEEIFQRDRKEHWYVRVLCKENTPFKKQFEKRGIEVKEVDYESQETIRAAMKGHIKSMLFNPFTDDVRLDMQGMNVLDVAQGEKIKNIVMLSSLGASSKRNEDTTSPLCQFQITENHLKQLNEYGNWVIFRIPFIQQYLYFWSQMISSQCVLGMPMSQTDHLETIHVKDICRCVAQAVLTKKSMVWQTLEKRVYDLRSTPSLNLSQMAKSLSDSLQHPELCSVIITEEQMECYLRMLSKDQAMTRLLESAAKGKVESPRPGMVQQGIQSLIQVLSAPLGDEDRLKWYPDPAKVLTPFCIRLILEHFKVSRNPQWMPVVVFQDKSSSI